MSHKIVSLKKRKRLYLRQKIYSCTPSNPYLREFTLKHLMEALLDSERVCAE